MLPFAVVLGVALMALAFLGWRVYDAPVDPEGAERTALVATEVLLRAGGGDASVCSNMEDVYAVEVSAGITQRCVKIAERTAAVGIGGTGPPAGSTPLRWMSAATRAT